MQSGVAAGTISPQRVSVLRGEVTDAAGGSLAGVQVTVLGHPEYGSTLTQSDGHFDMVVNGGGLQLAYAKAGYLPVQRLLAAPWQDYLTADTVAMTALSQKVSTIDPASDAPFQAATGSTPAAGADPSTLLFPAHDAATAHLPDGTAKALNGPLSVRVTEFPAGPQSLPGTMTGTVGPDLRGRVHRRRGGRRHVGLVRPAGDRLHRQLHRRARRQQRAVGLV